MTKSIELKNIINSSVNKGDKMAAVKPLIYSGLGALLIGAMVFPEIASAAPAAANAAFRPAAGLAAIVTPIKDAVIAHYATSIFVIGTIGAGLAPGDLRTRAQGFAIGAGLAGAAIIGVKATLGIV